jgi:hypothetical protein
MNNQKMKIARIYFVLMIVAVFSFTVTCIIILPNSFTNETLAQPIQIESQDKATLHINVDGASQDTGRMLIGVFGFTANNKTQPIVSEPALVDIGKMAQKYQADKFEVGTFNFTVPQVLGGNLYSCVFVPASNFTQSRCNHIELDTKQDSYNITVGIAEFTE